MNNSFDSIDRLMEFGMSMAVAQQMMRTMNYSMANMPVAGSGMPIAATQPQYHAVVKDNAAGPLNEEDVKSLIATGAITANTLVWKVGAAAWQQAKALPEINKWLLLNAKPQQL